MTPTGSDSEGDLFSPACSASTRARLAELARLFLKLGTTAFGGPAAHIALMEDEVVTRRRWLSREEFMDLLGATNLIPGPNSTEMAIHIGYRRAGWPGLFVAGTCFIIPAAIIVTTIAWMYVRFGQLPKVSGLWHGVKPVVLAVVAQALWRLGQSALKDRWLAAIAFIAAGLNFAGVHELIVLFAAAIVAAVLRASTPAHPGRLPLFAGPFLTISAGPGLATVAASSAAAPFNLWALALFFLKVGSVLFGSGYVLLAFIRGDLVERWHWLTEEQLMDAIAVGQFTPGPVFTTATFIGYLLGGYPGALVATVGIFLPAFIFVALSGPLVPLLRRSKTAGACLDGLNAASLALMAVVTVQLIPGALMNGISIAIAATSLVLLVHYKVNSAWLVAAGAVLGLTLF